MSKSQMQPRPALDHSADPQPYVKDSVTSPDTQADSTMSTPYEFPAPGPDSIVLHIPSKPEYVRVVRLALTGIASRMEFSWEDVEDMKLAVSEACNNAILHAAPGLDDCRVSEDKPAADASAAVDASTDTTGQVDSPPGSVMIAVTPYDNRLEITVVDEGYIAPPGLPRPSVAPPHGVDEELRESGLGLYLMQSLMDEVEHHTGENLQTVVRLVKYLPGYKIQAEIEANSEL